MLILWQFSILYFKALIANNRTVTFIGGGCCLKVAVCRASCFLDTWSCCAAAAAAARDSGMAGSCGSFCHSAFCFSK